MDKNSLLLTIAQKGYNIGFGIKKHFISYNIYSNLPRILSLLVVCIGVLQLTLNYKICFSSFSQEYISVVLICIGIIALLIDAGSKNKDEYNRVGKILTSFYNELQCIYNKIKASNDNCDLEKYKLRIQEIEKEFQKISISDQVPFTHIYANLSFFYGGTQIDWIDEQLHFTYKDKFPFYHSESIILYIIIIALIVIKVKRFF